MNFFFSSRRFKACGWGSLVCLAFSGSSSAYASNGSILVGLESHTWSRLFTSQSSYQAAGSGGELSGQRHFRLLSQEWLLGVRLQVQNVAYTIETTQRQGVAVGGGVGVGWRYEIDTNFAAHALLYYDPWRVMSVVSRETGQVNSQKIERASISSFSNGAGIETGIGISKGVVFSIFRRDRPLLLGGSLNYRLIQYAKVTTKTVHSQDSTQTIVSQTTPTQHHSITTLMSIGILLN